MKWTKTGRATWCSSVGGVYEAEIVLCEDPWRGEWYEWDVEAGGDCDSGKEFSLGDAKRSAREALCVVEEDGE